MAISISDAELLGGFLEAIVTGIFFAFTCVTIVAQWRIPGGNGFVIPIISFMLAIAVTHLTLTLRGAFESITPRASVVGLIVDNKFFVNTNLYTVQTLLGDIILTWRCYVIYSKRTSIIVFPIFCWLGYIATWIGEIINWVHPPTGATVAANDWVTSYFALNCAITLYTSLAMSTWCAYYASKLHLGWHTLFPIIIALIESGTLYTVATLGALITHVYGTSGEFAVVQVLPSVVGIIYCLIVLQIKFNTDLPSIRRLNTTTYLDTFSGEVGVHNHTIPSVSLPQHYTLPGTSSLPPPLPQMTSSAAHSSSSRIIQSRSNYEDNPQ